MRNPESICHLAEIVVLYGPRLLVHGDVPDVLFACFGGSYSEILDWVATSNIDYLSDKVLTQKEEFDRDIARSDLDEILAGWKSEDCGKSEKDVKELQHILYNVGCCHADLRDILQAVDSAGLDTEEFQNVGQVVNCDIIYAQEMVKKLLELIRS